MAANRSRYSTVPAGPTSSNKVVATADPSWTDTTAQMTSSGAIPAVPLVSAPSLIPDHLDHQPLRPAPVELDVEDGLPRPQVQPPLGDREHHLLVGKQVLQVRVAV